jgi:hypothetical protein
MIVRRFPEKHDPHSMGLSLCFVSSNKDFGDQAFSVSMFVKHHPHRQTLGYRKPWFVLIRLCECPRVELPGLIMNLGPVGLFRYCLFAVRARRNIITGAIFY